MPNESSDILGIGKVSELIGKLVEPSLIRKNAKARADGIKILKQTIDENINPITQIAVQSNGITIVSGPTTLHERAERTQTIRAQEKQQNFETVISNAYSEFQDEQEFFDGTLNIDWFTRFFEITSDISDKDIQLIWGKLLAGEIKHPKSYSLRTLDILKNLESSDARVFTDLTRYIFSSKGYEFLIYDEQILNKYGISFDTLSLMIENGLLREHSTFEIGLHSLTFDNKNYSLKLSSCSSIEQVKFESIVYVLTNSGKEIYKLANPMEPAPSSYVDDIAEFLRKYSDNLLVDVISKND